MYWTNSGPSNGIRILDLLLGHTASIINTGQSDRPRAIVVDPVNRYNITNYHNTLEYTLNLSTSSVKISEVTSVKSLLFLF